MFVSVVIMITTEACNESVNNSKNKGIGIKASTKIDTAVLNTKLTTAFDQHATGTFYVWENDTTDQLSVFKEVYQTKSSLWFEEQGINKQGSDLLKLLEDLQYDGLNIKKYRTEDLKSLSKKIQENATEQHVFSFETKMTNAFLVAAHDMILGSSINKNKEIKNANDSLVKVADILAVAIKDGNLTAAFERMRPQHPWYKKFRSEYVKLHQMKMGGGFQMVSNLKDSMIIGDSSAQIAILRKRLFQEVKLPADTFSQKWDDNVLQGLKKFQHLHHLKITGKLDTATLQRLNAGIDTKLATLALNMERMRWLKHDFKQPYIWVAIPKMEMDYIDHDTVEFNMRVVVGRPSRATPALDANILNVVLSPPWNVPPTIMREEVVPGIARRGGSYLARRGLRAYDRRGRQVSASAINSKNYRNFSIGQAPGYRSSLGEVKFNMPNPWAIYMHDTPHREDFVKFYRAYSSGCVRVEKPKEFATFLLRDSLNYSYQKIDSICKLRKTIFVPVKRNVDVHFVYLTNALDSAGNVMYLKDIYGWDKSL